MTFSDGFIDRINRYESDEMTREEDVAFIQELIDKDLIGCLQGHYGRTANAMIETGECHPK